MTTHSFHLNRDEFDLFIDDKNEKSGSKRRGKKSTIGKTMLLACICKRKARFFITRCFHHCCGRCLKREAAVVHFENHESIEVFFCPICKDRECEDLSWMMQKDVLEYLLQRNICICCFQIKTFGVTKCNHKICCVCIRQLLENPDTEQYQCPWNECGVKYDLTSLSDMYTDTLSEMDRQLFRRPHYSKSSCCRNTAVLELKKCYHTLCMNCADKALLVENSSENEENLQKCLMQHCPTKFPKECLEYHLQQLKSSMQMTTLFIMPVEGKQFQFTRRCDICNGTSHEVLIKLKLCLHKVCHPCLKNIVAKDTSGKLTTSIGNRKDVLKCPKADCYTNIPFVCVEAMDLALEGNLISVAMFLRPTRRNNPKPCSKCHMLESYIEIISCSHYLCRQCVMETIFKVTDSKLATCIGTSCDGTPVQCLKAVLSKPIEDILKNNVDYYSEITKGVWITERKECQQSNSSACGSLFTATVEKERANATRDQQFDLLCPSFGKKINCSSCRNMAVVVFETCSHGWCVECLESLISTLKDETLHCKYCFSCGSIKNADCLLKKRRTEGLLIPAYIKPVSGSRSCVCETNQALFEHTGCNHRYCKNCLLQSIALKCPLDDSTINTTCKTLNSRCVACSKFKPCTSMEPCRHVICMDCVLHVFVCPYKACKSSIDEESSMFLLTHIETQQENIFISREKGTDYDCSKCKKKFNGSNEIELIIRIKRCGHFICNQCFAELQELRKDLEISTCQFITCNELFFLPSLQVNSSTEEDTLNASNADKVTASSSITGVDNVGKQASVGKTGVESMNFTFKKLDCDKHGVRAKGLPNLGLTCYRNSVYQILAESPNFFSKLQHSTYGTDEDWTFTLCEILWRILSKSSSKGITEWLYRLQKEFSVIDDSFQEYGQNDSLSFLTSLLNGITEEIQRKRKILNLRSIEDPADIFRGEMHDKYTCQNCKKEEYAGLSYFFSLPLPTINAKTPKIGQCLYQFFEAETLKGVVNCPNCKHDTVSKETVIKTFPSILVLQLGMISEQQENFTRVQKSPKFWENFKGLTNNIHLSKINMTEFSKYTLFGVIVHIGGLSGGHYYSYVKRLEDEKWDLCDDSYVKRVDLGNVLCRDAYILFYHKCKRDTEF